MDNIKDDFQVKTILLTWWTWYIGSHWAVSFIEEWYKVIILDNLSNSDIDVLYQIELITWIKPLFYKADLRNKDEVEKVFLENTIDWVIHFAWAKAVWESCLDPFKYYENNLVWSLNLFEAMEKYAVKNMIFSSSATVYKPSSKLPYTEDTNTWDTTNPYGTTKLVIENLLRDLSIHKWFNVINLRYFNPIWAHKSWLIWEKPNDIPNNLLPYILKVAIWELEKIEVFWDDYDTVDWTWERDYIHVLDLIDWHLKAWDHIESNENSKWLYEVFNLWTWDSTSVLEMIKITEDVVWNKLKYKVVDRRNWDLATCYCLPEKANKILDWKTKFWVKEAIIDSWNFIQKQDSKT